MKKIILISGFYIVSLCMVQAQEVLTLEKAMEIAMVNSPDLRKSELSLKRSQSNLNAVRASYKASFSLTADVADYSKKSQYVTAASKYYDSETFESTLGFRIDQPIVASGGNIFMTDNFGYLYQYNEQNPPGVGEYPDQFVNDIRIGFSQPIFTYNRLKYDLMELELSYENTLLSYLLQRLSLERSITMSFYDVYERQMSLTISESELQNNEENYQIISNKVEGGLAALEELYQAEVNLASSKSTVYNKQVALENAKDQFKIMAGMDLDYDFLAMTNVEVTPIQVKVSSGIDLALNNRMELRQRKIAIEKDQFALIYARKNNADSFNGTVSGSFGLSGRDHEIGMVTQNNIQTPRFAISLNIPIYDWGKRKNKIAAAEADIEMSEIDYTEQKRDIVITVRQVYRELENIKNQIEIAELNVKNAQLTFDINQERYNNGDITGMDLNLYQNQLSDKKMALTNALIDYKIELLNLKIQTLYDFENNEPIVPEELVSPNVEK